MYVFQKNILISFSFKYIDHLLSKIESGSKSSEKQQKETKIHITDISFVNEIYIKL